jgi:hypothetical protein
MGVAIGKRTHSGIADVAGCDPFSDVRIVVVIGPKRTFVLNHKN